MIWTADDTWIIVTGMLAAMSCALLGSFLVLRKLSMMGDAISHTVLPGIALAYILVQSRDNIPMFIGACVVGIITAILVQTVNRFGELEEGASMGVIFTSLFAIGLLLIQRGARAVDLDPDCVLYGAIELTVFDSVRFLGLEMPRAVLTNGSLLLLNVAFVCVFFKELKITSFDPALAKTLGINPTIMHYVLMVLVAATCVAAFESVGSIIVIAMLIVPGAAALLLTDRLGFMLLIALLLATIIAALGHLSAIVLPSSPVATWLGSGEVTTAGMMGAVAGFLFLMVALFAPRRGVLSRLLFHLLLSYRISRDDVLAFLYRHEELDPSHQFEVRSSHVREALRQRLSVQVALWDLTRKRLVAGARERSLKLTPEGTRRASQIVRAHRLWETYLVTELGLRADHVHPTAKRLEPVTDEFMRREIALETNFPQHDPHERPIPKTEN